MLARLKAWLFGSSRDHAHSARVKMKARDAAYARIEDALRRQDDRDLGRARMAFQVATHDLLRAELGR